MSIGVLFCAVHPVHSILQSGDFTQAKTVGLFVIIVLIALVPLFVMLYFKSKGHEGFAEHWRRMMHKFGRQTIFAMGGMASALLVLYAVFDDLHDPNGYASPVCHDR